jgi:hypothetical protein
MMNGGKERKRTMEAEGMKGLKEEKDYGGTRVK